MAVAAETGQKTFCPRQKPLNSSNKTLIRQLFTDDRNPAVAAATAAPGTTVLGTICSSNRLPGEDISDHPMSEMNLDH
ncbi:hypothetical protein E3N88_09608 [Mikania micrantha]|uniref:Uncharacterized protein n=1 Tax=Mikania micrantha TaxID=192012 RepID=A0A5N6PK82_9ASTR|nr:hypothetical protein E3N88_09608 [Mikania micrantha]